MPTYYNKGGVRIEIRPKENGHNEPHVHVIYAGESMSVSIITGEILAGKINSPKVNKIVNEWIKKNVKTLLREWRKYHV